MMTCFELNMRRCGLFCRYFALNVFDSCIKYTEKDFFFSHYQSTAGGDLSMLFTLHAGFEPTLPRWLSAPAGWKGRKKRIGCGLICVDTIPFPS